MPPTLPIAPEDPTDIVLQEIDGDVLDPFEISGDMLGPFEIVEEETTSFIGKVFFTFLDRILKQGAKTQLEMEDLSHVSSYLRCAPLLARFDALWSKEKEKEDPSLVRVYWKLMVPTVLTSFPFILLWIVLPLLSPYFLQWSLESLGNAQPWIAFGYIAGMGCSTLLATLCGGYGFRLMWQTGLTINAVNVSAMYRKAFTLSNSAKQSITQGEIMNRISSDAQTIFNFASMLIFLFAAPIQLIAALVLLYERVSYTLFSGLGAMLLLVPFFGFLGMKFDTLATKKQETGDKRLKIVQDVLNGIKLVRFYSWEKSICKRIAAVRAVETNILFKYLLTMALFMAGFGLMPIMAVIAIFTTFSLVFGASAMTTPLVFSTLQLMDFIRIPMAYLPMLVSMGVTSMVSVRRVKKFLLMDERKNMPMDKDVVDAVFRDADEDVVAVIRNGAFAWKEEEEEEEKEKKKEKEEKEVAEEKGGPVLTNINLEARKGQVTMVVSPVGGGKSSLLSALLGEIDPVIATEQAVAVRGSIAVVQQKPWLASMSIKDNILAGSQGDVDQRRLKKVIKACALEEDLKAMPAGLDTEIGERGLNLSGGQVARVALARAVYADADLYLLDDVLSAVDAHVGKHIFEKVLSPGKGMLKDKAVILTTNQLQFLAYAHRVIVLDSEGQMTESGPFDELMAAGLDFSALIKEHAKDVKQRQHSHALDSPEVTMLPMEMSADDLGIDKTVDKSDVGKLVQEEERHAGSVPMKVYTRFIGSGGGAAFYIGYFLICGLSVGAVYLANVWLAIWTSGTWFPGATLEFYLGGYGVVFLIGIVLNVIMAVVFSYGFTRAVTIIHNRMLESVIHSPMEFFDTTPTGRSINRFSKDVFQCDMEAPTYLTGLINGLFQIFISLIIAGVVAPAIFAVIVPVVVVFYYVQEYFRRSSREVQRLDATSKSHVLTHFSESIAGYTVLHAFGLTKKYMRDIITKIDDNHRAYYIAKIAQRWLGVRAGILSAFLVISMGVILALFNDTIAPAFAGLALVSLNGLMQILEDYVEIVAETEMRFVSVERIQEYIDLPTEPSDGDKADESWPSNGHLVLDQVSMRYRDELPLVLKDVSFEVKCGEKLGVVGRTGSGKSTLAVVLFRVVEPCGGTMLVDGTDLSKMCLEDLRHGMTIIPQTPVLFEGSVRYNLDPFDACNDTDVWASLETVQLKSTIAGLPGKLESPVREGGANFSVGQRQLMCFARALLRKPKILILDEATASVDVKTDSIIQRVIRSQFKSATVITVAHRLNTIMDSDRVLVMEDGHVAEHDTPLTLLNNSNSLFSVLCSETGKKNAEHLRELAEKAAVVEDKAELVEEMVEMEKDDSSSESSMQ